MNEIFPFYLPINLTAYPLITFHHTTSFLWRAMWVLVVGEMRRIIFFTVFNPLLPRSLSGSIVFAPPVFFMVPRTVIMKERKHTTSGTYLF